MTTQPQTRYNTGRFSWSHNEPIYQGGWVVRWLLGPCPKCGSVTSTYGGSYSCHNDSCPHHSGNFACSAGPRPAWWNTGVNVALDGSQWCATGRGFTNLQECPAGFGPTPDDAVADLLGQSAQPTNTKE